MTKEDILEERIKNMENQNNKEHSEIKELLKTMSDKLDNLEGKYVTRLEFKAVSLALGFLATLIGIIVFFID